ncbi:CaiB/BaiF CoA transferase family protein [Blastochloris viridis]|uniref:Formyl-coenzyme A transferase n=1 Tax=Blastochloris viridis TaxID=1079 RepID=A0A0H5BD92_BLAVI|nr:CaiB/BaiF CoA-transferase family protein [Blastochloris viridis]ALK09892.1 Succinyl-CoA:(R)-benzylsuccinate CoA-transferase subunit BbsF [Blastochloris viridis]BAS00203.1 L-carnitine dehydratase/bile acid-inducible protein F [Blastochloris viridis]CUU42555.1 Formyl-coenzyme A transferase [Blastochloris viridis]
MTGALSHLRVLDLSRVLAGPWASQMLADLGAEVIKIERPGEGDDTRHWGPPFLCDAAGNDTGESAYFIAANRGKQSLAVDFTHPEGQALIRRLAAQCDVVLENFKVGGLAKYGLDYPSLRAVRPNLVYCSITGFGQDGPLASRAGYDFLVQGMGGLMSLTGDADGEPMKVGVALADVFTGLYATVAVLAALAHRDRTGQGQHIDLALLDVQIAVLANQASSYLVGGVVPKRMGNAHPSIVPYQAFATRDGHVILAVGNDGQFRRFCATAGCMELADDSRFATNVERVRNRDDLVARLRLVMATRTTPDWIAALEAAGVPCGPINRLDQVFENEQVRHRGLAATIPHPLAGEVKVVANPIRLSETPVSYRRSPPLLGADTEALLSGLLGLGPDEIADLKARGVIDGTVCSATPAR